MIAATTDILRKPGGDKACSRPERCRVAGLVEEPCAAGDWSHGGGAGLSVHACRVAISVSLSERFNRGAHENVGRKAKRLLDAGVLLW